MFSRGHGKPKKESGSKKHHIRNWARSRKKKKNEANLFAVMTSGDSSPPVQASSTGFDMLDDARLVKITPTTSTKTSKPVDVDAEAIESAVPIMQRTLPIPEPKPKIEKNGIDVDTGTKNKLLNQPEDDSCVVNCIYFTQQCCECTIL